jgi:phenylacetate-coenzyme A ligase PaaK-like adenylate-forming protein
VICKGNDNNIVFSSSGTTGNQNSRHYVKDISLYEESFFRSFEMFFGKPDDYIILALLPSYLEREGSSLIYMVDHLMQKSDHPENGFYLHEYEELSGKLQILKNQGKKVILIGVSFALLDMAERHPLDFPDLVIIETGGMKGRRQELVREELHNRLKKAFSVDRICSEYGMTELLSQAYSMGEGLFMTPPWMKILIRDTNDPFTLIADGRTGGINVIDLANIHSCSFIATQDLGKMNKDGRFEVLGRFDNSDVRGCNLMVG